MILTDVAFDKSLTSRPNDKKYIIEYIFISLYDINQRAGKAIACDM